MRFSREISLGSVLQVIAYAITIIIFSVSLSADVGALKAQIGDLKIQNERLEKQITALSGRVDYHIDRSK